MLKRPPHQMGKEDEGFVAGDGGGCAPARGWHKWSAVLAGQPGSLRRHQAPPSCVQPSTSGPPGSLSRPQLHPAALCWPAVQGCTAWRLPAYALMAAPSQVRLGRRSRSFCFSLGSLMLEARPHFSSCLITTQVMSHW